MLICVEGVPADLDVRGGGPASRESQLLNPWMAAQSIHAIDNHFTGNTTLAIVITSAAFDKPKLCKITGMAHDRFARAIRPVHTSADSDSIYAVSTGSVQADRDLVDSLAAEVISEAILRTVNASESAYGLPAAAALDAP